MTLKVVRGLDPMPSNAKLIEMYYERHGRRVGPASPLLDDLKRQLRKERKRPILSASGSGRVITDDDIDPFGKMNAWERERAGELEVLRLAKIIRWWRFEELALRLANKTFYHTDFAYQYAKDGQLVVEEVKGFMRDDAAVKLKVAAREYPFIRFLLVRRPKGTTGWMITEVKAA